MSAKKETLEEAAVNYAHNWFDMHETNNYKALNQGFVAGAKWQAERMYSEEDMRCAWEEGKCNFRGLEFGANRFNEWIEQFKKNIND